MFEDHARNGNLPRISYDHVQKMFCAMLLRIVSQNCCGSCCLIAAPVCLALSLILGHPYYGFSFAILSWKYLTCQSDATHFVGVHIL